MYTQADGDELLPNWIFGTGSTQGWHWSGRPDITLDACKDLCVRLGDCAEVWMSQNTGWNGCYPSKVRCDGAHAPDSGQGEKAVLGSTVTLDWVPFARFGRLRADGPNIQGTSTDGTFLTSKGWTVTCPTPQYNHFSFMPCALGNCFSFLCNGGDGWMERPLPAPSGCVSVKWAPMNGGKSVMSVGGREVDMVDMKAKMAAWNPANLASHTKAGFNSYKWQKAEATWVRTITADYSAGETLKLFEGAHSGDTGGVFAVYDIKVRPGKC